MGSSIKSIFPGLSLNQVETLPYALKVAAQATVLDGTPVYLWNASIELFEADENALYYLKTWSFSCDIDQLVFSRSLRENVSVKPFRADVTPNTPLNQRPALFNQFVESSDVDMSFTAGAGFPVVLKIQGVLEQTPELLELGLQEVNAFINVVIYKTTDSNFIAKEKTQ